MIGVGGLDYDQGGSEANPESAIEAEVPQPSRRSNRSRSKPKRYGMVGDDQDHVDSEEEMIPSWYPGWNKERTRNYILNDNNVS